jgi:phosphonate transport system substrate-binding protein
VVPQFPALEIERDWKPLLAALSESTGLRFRLHIEISIPAFESNVFTGVPDLAYMSAYHLVADGDHGRRYVPLVRSGVQPMHGVIVVSAASTVRSIQDLNGKRIAFPSPNAFGASLYMRAALSRREGITFTPLYTGTHTDAYRVVVQGTADAGGGLADTLSRESEALRRALRVIYRTPDLPSHPLAASSRIPAADRDRITDALLAMAATDKGRHMLLAVQLTQPVRADYDRDYASVAALRLDQFAAPPGASE